MNAFHFQNEIEQPDYGHKARAGVNCQLASQDRQDFDESGSLSRGTVAPHRYPYG